MIGRENTPAIKRYTIEQMKNQPVIREALRAHGVRLDDVNIPVSFQTKEDQQSGLIKPYIFLDERSGYIDWGQNHYIFSYQFCTSAYAFYMNISTQLLPEAILGQIKGKLLSTIIDLPGAVECMIEDTMGVGDRTVLILIDSGDRQA